MPKFKTRSELALYVWDYFYVAHTPARKDEAIWTVIERAVCRIYESEGELRSSNPSDLRLRSARRVRNAVRSALRHIKLLSVAPEQWVIDGLAELGTEADKEIAAARAEPVVVD